VSGDPAETAISGEAPWWHEAVIYQVYPRSFQDSDGDGVGDLRGIIARLDHLRWLGVDAVWVSPFYPSPMADFGYDVADYTGVDPVFGTLDDFDALVAAAHARRLKVILDFVPNHSSDRHPWFVESRSSRDNPKRDWYIWRDPPPGGGPPNNWLSEAGGSAWEWDEATGQYYYHAFLPQQPDLNWRNPELVSVMHDVLRFWLDRGVDGFRVDVLWHLIKDDQFRDNPPNPAYRPGEERPNATVVPLYSADQPEVHEVVAGLRRVLDEYDDRLLIGEIYLPLERLMAYYGADASGAHLPFNFTLLGTRWTAAAVSRTIDEYEAALPENGWPNWVLGNHDKPRILVRVGAAQARVAAMLLLTLRGTLTMYYGDEIGMPDVEIPPDRVVDPWELRMPGLGLGRDPCRTPMQWDESLQAGFTTGRPWLPLASDWRSDNVAVLKANAGSILCLYRALLARRRASPALTRGAYRRLSTEGDVLIYLRSHPSGERLVALNFDDRPAGVRLPAGMSGRVALSTHMDRQEEGVSGELALRPDEGILLELDSS
jgi:alpha-glucosidase